MTNESAILGLLAELYQRNAALTAENTQLRQALALLEEARQQQTAPADKF